MLHGRAEALLKLCVARADGRIERLKLAVTQVAEAEGVWVAALADHMAFRLSQQGENWWGAARNLQRDNVDPWQIARDTLMRRVDMSGTNEVDRVLLLQSMFGEGDGP